MYVQDSTLLVTGSADKNIKFWGLDFGDCHKSIFAHDDSIMAVQVSKQSMSHLSTHPTNLYYYCVAQNSDGINLW